MTPLPLLAVIATVALLGLAVGLPVAVRSGGGHWAHRPPEPGPGPCYWPDCLTPEQQDELAEEVGRQMCGEPASPPVPDQRAVCDCDGAPDPDWDREPEWPPQPAVDDLPDIDQYQEHS